jgi:hypothetical protein
VPATPVWWSTPRPGAGVALRVEVDDQDVGAVQRQRRGQVDGAGGLADAALLVGHGDHSPRGRPGKSNGRRG